MTTIAGASRFLNQAAYVAKVGTNFDTGNMITQSGLSGDLLEAGRGNRVRGLGLSSTARLLNKQQIDKSSEINQLFSLTGGGSSTIEAAQTQIKALRSSVPFSRLNPELRAQLLDESAEGTAAAETGREIDETA